jgi:pyrimidine deaminase RibD-like protein
MFYYSDRDLARFMQECVKLAIESPKDVPRPFVGAVVVKEGVIVGRGNKRYDPILDLDLHAEFVALLEAGTERTKNALLVTTLEPCCPSKGYKSTIKPTRVRSCCEQILEYGISEVVYGSLDCSPTIHDARGIHFLSENKVETTYLRGLVPHKFLMYHRPNLVGQLSVSRP